MSKVRLLFVACLLLLPLTVHGQDFSTPGRLPATGVDPDGQSQQVTYTLRNVGRNINATASIGRGPPQDITDIASFALRQAGYPDHPVDFMKYAQSVAHFAGGTPAAGLISFPWQDFVARVNDWIACCRGDIVTPFTGLQNYIGSKRSGGQWTNLGGIGPLDTPPLSGVDDCARTHDAKMWAYQQFAPGSRVLVISTAGDMDFVVPKSYDDINKEVADCFTASLAADGVTNSAQILYILSSTLAVVTVQYENNLKGSANPGIMLLTPTP